MATRRGQVDRRDRGPLPGRAAAEPAPLPGVGLSNRGLAALLGIQREEGWTNEPAGSKNRGGPSAITAPGGGRTVRRHAIRGIQDPQMLTDRAIAIIPDGLPADGSAVDVLVHLHGHQLSGYGAGYEDAGPKGGAAPIDLGVMKLEEQMSAAGRPLVGLLPQGSSKSDFSSAKGSGFDLPGFVAAAFARLTADGAWSAGAAGQPAGAQVKAPTPGRLVLSGHSGADQPIVQMLAGGKIDDLAGLFLFDTMYVSDAEKEAKPKKPTPRNWPLYLEGKVEAYVKKRFDADLAAVRAAPGPDRKAYVEQRGFRLTVVHAKGSYRYGDSSERLREVVEGWIAALDPKDVGADAIDAIKRNYVFKTAATSEHMQVMGEGNFAGAIATLPLSVATGTGAPAGAQAPPSSAPGSGGVQRALALLASASGSRAAARALARAGSVGPRGPVAIQRDDGDGEAVDYAAEFASFSARDHIENGLAGYRDIRDVFIATFGSIARANAYYRGVRHVAFLGRRPLVHEDTLGAKLEAAERLLTASGQRDQAAAALTQAGGFNIRRNRNAPSRLSDHSFGWAVDLNQDLSPNMSGRFPGRAIMAATGKDVVSDEMETINQGGTAAEMLAPIQEIHAASDAFKDAFADEASLGAAMRTHLVDRMKFRIADDVPLLEMVKKAAGTGKAGAKAKAELGKLLRDNWGSIPDAERWLDAGDREQIVANKGWKAWKAEKAKRDKAEEKAMEKFRKRRGEAAAKHERLEKAGKSDEEIRKAVDEPLQQAEIAEFEAEVGRLADRAASLLIEMWGIFVSSFRGGKIGGARVAAQTEGTPGTVAAHGFVGMPSELAAALVGSDGGDLDWLGAAGVHDFMHFQLKPGDRPSLR